MTSHFNALTEAEQERLAILIEECTEVAKAGCKILRHGYESVNPDVPQSETNREQLQREIGHVLHAVQRMERAADVSRVAITAGRDSKAERIRPYLHHQDER